MFPNHDYELNLGSTLTMVEVFLTIYNKRADMCECKKPVYSSFD